MQCPLQAYLALRPLGEGSSHLRMERLLCDHNVSIKGHNSTLFFFKEKWKNILKSDFTGFLQPVT